MRKSHLHPGRRFVKDGAPSVVLKEEIREIRILVAVHALPTLVGMKNMSV